MKKLMFIYLILACVIQLNAQQHDVHTRYENIYGGEATQIDFDTFDCGFTPFVSATCTQLSGGIIINSFGNGYVIVTGTAIGAYEILHYARFLNGSTITTTIKGEIKRRTASGGGNEEEAEEVDRNEIPKLP